jgi:RNA binding exosome subunit
MIPKNPYFLIALVLRTKHPISLILDVKYFLATIISNVPYFSINHARRNVMLSTLSDDFVNHIKAQAGPSSPKLPKSTTPTLPHPIIKHNPIPNWNPIPENHNLPDHLIPFIPTFPLYSGSGKTYYAPGSKEWERKIRQIHKKHQQRLKKEQAKAKKLLNIDPVRLEKQQNADYHGTTIEYLETKFDKIDSLSYFTDRFDYQAKQLQKFLSQMDPTSRQDLGELKKRNNNINNLSIRLPKKKKSKKATAISSEIIKPLAFETRLNKRPSISTTESSSYKKTRPASPCPEDHENVGTSIDL